MRETMWRMLAATVMVVALGGVSPANARTRGGEALREMVARQLELDVTPIPPGMGALFVPSLTEPRVEAPVVVFRNGVQVAVSPTGQRTVLPPGTYTAKVRSLKEAPEAEARVVVVQGTTTPVPPFFGGLRIDVVAPSGAIEETPIAVSPTRGSGAALRFQSASGHHYGDTETWLLPAGRYVIALMEGGAASGSSIAISLHEGEVLEYRLVVRDGQILRAEFREDAREMNPSIWRFSWVIGVEGSMQDSRRQLTAFSGRAVQAAAFMRAALGLDVEGHIAVLQVDLDESWLGLDGRFGQDLPAQKLRDEATAEILYSYRLKRLLGPYIRGFARTSFFDTNLVSDDLITLRTHLDEGGQKEKPLDEGESERLLKAGHPLVLQADAGLGFSPFDNRWFTLWFRGGAGARRSMFSGGSLATDRVENVVTLWELADEDSLGAVFSARATIKLSQLASYTIDFDGLVPYQQIQRDEDFRPLYRWEHLIALRLWGAASIVYSYQLARDHLVIDADQTTHNLAFRLQTALF